MSQRYYLMVRRFAGFFLRALFGLLIGFAPYQVFADCKPGDGRPFCNADCKFTRMEQADWAMRSTDLVKVDHDNKRFVSFTPRVMQKDTGLVIFHGGAVDWSAYAPMAHWAAEAGYKTVLARFGRDGMACLTPPAPIFFPQISEILDDETHSEISQWVFAGHSLGGVLASSYLALTPKRRTEVKGMVFWSSYSVFNLALRPRFGQLSGDNVLASKDRVATWPLYALAAINLPRPTQTLCIEGGNHAQFGWYGPQSDEDDAQVTISREEQQEAIRARLVHFLGQVDNPVDDKTERGTGDRNMAATRQCRDIDLF